jgi:hypothetical protein
MPSSRDIREDIWYVIDLALFPIIKLHSKAFAGEEDAYNAIDRGLYGNHKRYDVIQGKEALEMGLCFWGQGYRLTKRARRINKYNLPRKANKKRWSEYTFSRQHKKSFRTLQRLHYRQKLLEEHRKLNQQNNEDRNLQSPSKTKKK